MNKYDFVKYGKLVALADTEEIRRYVSRDFMVFEKVDGGNCQVRNLGGCNLVAGSKANFLRGKNLKKCEWFSKLTAWMRSNASFYHLPDHLILFGEWSGNHTIEYTPEHTDKFFVLDVYDQEKKRFSPYPEGECLLRDLRIQDVQFLPVLVQGKIAPSDLTRLLKEPSKYYGGPKEGLVLKAYEADPQIRLKVYHPDFSEKVLRRDGRIFYLSPARFRKNIHRLCEEKGLKRVNQQHIIDGVIEDIYEEEGVSVLGDDVRQYLTHYLQEGKLLRAARYLGE